MDSWNPASTGQEDAKSHDYLVHRGDETETHTAIVLRPAPSRLTP